MKIKGTIRRTDVEGGHWVLDADGGERYQLVGKVDGAKDGLRAEVDGKVDKQAMGFAMLGPQLEVTKIVAL
jgi:hypothetical protein